MIGDEEPQQVIPVQGSGRPHGDVPGDVHLPLLVVREPHAGGEEDRAASGQGGGGEGDQEEDEERAVRDVGHGGYLPVLKRAAPFNGSAIGAVFLLSRDGTGGYDLGTGEYDWNRGGLRYTPMKHSTLLLLVGFLAIGSGGAGAGERISVLVLPFDAASPDVQWAGRGVGQNLVAELSAIPAVSAIAGAKVATSPEDAASIARPMGRSSSCSAGCRRWRGRCG